MDLPIIHVFFWRKSTLTRIYSTLHASWPTLVEDTLISVWTLEIFALAHWTIRTVQSKIWINSLMESHWFLLIHSPLLESLKNPVEHWHEGGPHDFTHDWRWSVMKMGCIRWRTGLEFSQVCSHRLLHVFHTSFIFPHRWYWALREGKRRRIIPICMRIMQGSNEDKWMNDQETFFIRLDQRSSNLLYIDTRIYSQFKGRNGSMRACFHPFIGLRRRKCWTKRRKMFTQFTLANWREWVTEGNIDRMTSILIHYRTPHELWWMIIYLSFLISAYLRASEQLNIILSGRSLRGFEIGREKQREQKVDEWKQRDNLQKRLLYPGAVTPLLCAGTQRGPVDSSTQSSSWKKYNWRDIQKGMGITWWHVRFLHEGGTGALTVTVGVVTASDSEHVS